MADVVKALAELLRGEASVREIEGFYGSSRAYVLARLLTETDAPPLLVIEPTVEDAEALLADLRFFLPSEDDGPFSTPAGVLYFPGEEALPYDGVAYSAAASMQ